jgi:hypothetical protein
MPPERTTLSAQVDSDTELEQQFEQFRDQNGMTSKSEAVRHLLRSGLEQELEQPDDAADDGSAQSTRATTDAAHDAIIDINLIRGNEAIIFGFAFLVGSNGILSALTDVLGGLGAAVWAVVALLLSFWLIVDSVRQSELWTNRQRDDANATAGAD